MHVPAANIVVTFDVNAMVEFQNTKDLGVFKKYIKEREAQSEYKRETFIFTNSPNSSLLSLDHTFATGDESKIKIKLIDPENQLEKEILDTNLGDELSAENDPFGRKLEQLQQEKDLANNELARLKAEYNKTKFDKKKSVENLRNKQEQAKVKDKLDQILTEIDNVDDWNVDDYNQLMNSQLGRNVNKLQRAVYITYGVGTNLQDWAPPQCFGQIIRYDYSFTGDGVRVLTLELAAKSINPNLTQMGLKPLGKNFLKGLSNKGVSQFRLFSEEGIEQSIGRFEKYYKINQEQSKELRAKLAGTGGAPIHLPITEAVEDYIKNGTNQKDNVLCFMPDLDFYLSAYYKKCMKGSRFYTRSRNGIVKARYKVYDAKLGMLGYKKVMDGLGLKMCEVGSSPNKSAAIGKNVYKYIEECRSEDVVDEWFEQNDYRVMMHTDMMKLTLFQGLEALGQAIKSKITEFPVKDANGAAPPPMNFMTGPEVITDFNLIQIMFEKGLIENRRKPVIIWGERNIIQKVLYGTIYETAAKDRVVEKEDEEPPPPTEINEYAQEKMLDWVSPFDVAKGITIDYVRDVFDYYVPTSWVGPFGRQYNGADELDAFLPGDTNLSQSKALKELDNPLLANRLPLFTFGTKYPNVLSVDFEKDNHLQTALTTAAPVGRQQFSNAPGIIPDDFQAEANRVFDGMENLDLEDVDPDTDVPKGFITLMQKYYDYDYPSGDDLKNFDEWQEIFNKLNPDKYADMSDQSFYSDIIGGLDSEQKFFKFMWEHFSELYKYVRPTMDKSNEANDPSEAVIADSVRAIERLNELALSGKIKTLPMFSLAIDRRVTGKACVLYCVEPRIYLPNRQDDNYGGNITWFSGVYSMVGFAHTISKNNVGSTFYITRPGNKALAKKEEVEVE